MIHRFSANDPLSWRLWPDLEARLERVCPTLTPETPVPMLLKLLREAFANGTPLVAVWGLLKDERITGHLIGWTETSWGNNYALVHQAHTDNNEHGSLMAPMMAFLGGWIDDMNKAGVTPPITHIRMLTERGAAFSLMFKGKCVYDRSVILIEAPPPKSMLGHAPARVISIGGAA